MRREWDVVVIGAGVAGLTAAQTVTSQGLSCACIDRLGPGGALMNLGRIHDWPDAEPGATGADVIAALSDKAMEAGAEMVFGEVRRLSGGPPWIVATDDEEHEAKLVILATGLSAGSLGIANEEEFEGRGLSHCATCDGPMFAGQNVVVTGDDRWTAHEALELADTAAQVTLVGAAPDAPHAAGNLATVLGRIVELRGAAGLESVIVEHAGARQELPATGLFAYQDRRPQLGFLGEPLPTDARGWVLVDGTLQTRVPFIFAIGDVRSGSAESVAGAVSDGRAAGLAAAGLLKR